MWKGDGPCLYRTAAAHTLGDEEEGPGLARDSNTHQSEYREYYEEKIAADFPLTITIGVKGEFKVFETPTEYFDWLQESNRAAFMWRGCVDVIAMSNMANIEIKVIIHEEGKQPEIQLYKPDPKFPWKQEDPMRILSEKKIKQGQMIVLNWKNTHFNLIVGPMHIMSKVGSISHQTQINQATSGLPSRQKQVLMTGPDRELSLGAGDIRKGEVEKIGITTTTEANHKNYENHESCKLKLIRKDTEIRKLKS